MCKNEWPIAVVEEEAGTIDVLCEGLRSISDNITVFNSSLECLDHIELGKYDLLITAVMLPEFSGLDLVKQVRKIDPGMAVLVMTGYANMSLAISSFRAGAVDFIEKPFTPDEIAGTVKRIIVSKPNAGREGFRSLTKSELIILKEIVEGLSNSQIAHKLSRSVRTVEDHRANLMRKLRADNIVDLVKKTMDIGLVDLRGSD